MNRPGRTAITRLCFRFATGINCLLALGFLAGTLTRLLSADAVLGSDFMVFRSAWWLVLHGQGRSLYDASAQRLAQHLLMGTKEFAGGLMAFLNPPHVAIAGAPLGWVADHIGLQAAFGIWTACNLLLLARLGYWLQKRLDGCVPHAKWLVVAAVLAFYPVTYTIAVGQLSLLLAVAVCGLLDALEGASPLKASAWLMTLSSKPQLLLPFVLFIVVRGNWQVLRWFVVLASASVIVTSIVLGAAIWPAYVRSLHGLEQFFGAGTPTYMMNLRGALTRALGSNVSSDARIYAVSVSIWCIAVALLGVHLYQRRQTPRTQMDLDFTVTLAVALFFNPHLFVQDTVLWTVGIAAYLRATCVRDESILVSGALAIAWPLLFALSRVWEQRAGLGHVNPAVLVVIVTLVFIVKAAMQQGPLRLDRAASH